MTNIPKTYPFTTIEMYPGDILYSQIAKSTFFVGHAVIIGTDYTTKEVLPGTPAWRTISIERFWNRHNRGDEITLLRSKVGAKQAAIWITDNLSSFKTYNLLNFNINNLDKSYCYKFIAQAYYFGANVKIVENLQRPLLPNDIKKSPKLQKVVVIVKG